MMRPTSPVVTWAASKASGIWPRTSGATSPATPSAAALTKDQVADTFLGKNPSLSVVDLPGLAGPLAGLTVEVLLLTPPSAAGWTCW